MKEHRIRHACRLALVSALLPLAVGTSAQSAMHWKGTVSRAPQPLQANTGLPAPIDSSKQVAAGFDVQRFEAVANQLVANGRIPGLAMAIVKDGQILSARGYGVTDARNPQPVDAHTVFRLASLSKSFAGTVTGMLVNDGVLRWDSHLTDYVPEFRLSLPNAAQQVTVADVLSHRVGLTHNAFDRDLEGNADYHSLTMKLANAPMKCAPGECYAYQNVAFSLIGDVVFATTGQFFSETVARRIFKPLGMHDASYARGHPGQRTLGAPARPRRRRLGTADTQAHLLPCRARGRRQRQHQRHGAVDAGANGASPRRAARPLAGHPACASGRYPERNPGCVVAAHATEFRGLRAWLARVQLCRQRRGLPRRCGAGISRRDGAATRQGPRRGAAVEQRKRAAQRTASDDPGQRARPGRWHMAG